MSQMLALLLIVAILYIGDAISVRTKAWIPSVFVCAVLFLIGYWTFFPKDIVSVAGIGTPVAVMMMYLLITNMGTLLSLKELVNQWKTIVISLAGIAGITAAIFVVCMIMFDLNTAIVTIPPLVGGIVSSIIMSKGAADAGLVDLSVFAILIYVMQGFAGYPLTAIMLQREGKRVLKKYRAGQWKDDSVAPPSDKHEPTTRVAEDKMPRLFSAIPTPATLNSSGWQRWLILPIWLHQQYPLSSALVRSYFVCCLVLLPLHSVFWKSSRYRKPMVLALPSWF